MHKLKLLVSANIFNQRINIKVERNEFSQSQKPLSKSKHMAQKISKNKIKDQKLQNLNSKSKASNHSKQKMSIDTNFRFDLVNPSSIPESF